MTTKRPLGLLRRLRLIRGDENTSAAPRPPASRPDHRTPVRPLPGAGQHATNENSTEYLGWNVISAPREPWLRRARRVAVVALATVIVLAGMVNIAGQLVGWLRPPIAPAAPAVADSAYAAVAVPFAVDYLSWDQTRLPARQTALRRAAGPDSTVDGWGGTGRQWADSATLLHVARREPDHAIATVRARVTAYQPANDANRHSTDSTDRTDAGPVDSTTRGTPSTNDTHRPSTQDPNEPAGTTDTDTASGPVLGTPGWIALPSRWLNLAVPLQHISNRIMVTAPPAIVGSPPTTVLGPAVDRSAANNAELADTTRGGVRTLLTSYARGDLTYARAAGTGFTGLSGAAELTSVTSWRARPAQDTAVGGERSVQGAVAAAGDVTVVWNLPGGASLTCSYRIELDRDAGRWYLADITVLTEAVTR